MRTIIWVRTDSLPADPDPGWSLAFHNVGWFFLLQLGERRIRRKIRDGRLDALSALRGRYLFLASSFVALWGLLGLVIVRNTETSHWDVVLVPAEMAWGAVAVLGTGCWVAVVRMRPIVDCDSTGGIARSYTQRTTLRAALAGAPLLVAAVLVPYLHDAPLLLGAVLTSSMMVYAAPTRQRIERDQHRIEASGCERSLVGSLLAFSPPDDA